jgi:hypothetical protein
MKYIENSPLFGRVERGFATVLTVDESPLTPVFLASLTLRTNLPPAINTLDNQRKVNALLDALEDGEKAEYLEIGDTDWDFLRPLMETVVLSIYQRHTPTILDELDARINRGKVEQLPEANGHKEPVGATKDIMQDVW